MVWFKKLKRKGDINMNEAKTCKTCQLPEWYVTYYGDVKLDKEDDCFFCKHYENTKDAYEIDYCSGKAEFEKLVEQSRGKGEYECIVLYTGGKDSSYTLYLMSQVYGLKTLALTWDNGFFNDINTDNIEVTARNLGVEHRYIRTDWDVLKHIYKNRLKSYGRFCNCVPLCFLYTAPVIYETKAPLVLFSSSFGQIASLAEINARIDTSTGKAVAPIGDIIKNMGAVPIKNAAMEQYYTMLLDLVVGDLPPKVLGEMKYLLSYVHKLMSVEDSLYVNPSVYFDWDMKQIINKIKEYGWKQPEDKGIYGHTSCIAERMKGYLAYKQNLINFDIIENSLLLRTGRIDIEEFNREIECTGFTDVEPEVHDLFLEKLDMTREELNDIMNNKLAIRDSIPEINTKNLECLPVDTDIDDLVEKLKRTYKTRLTI